MNQPAISLGCPVYNSDETRLRRSLDSVLAQTFTDLEVIICDNSPGSQCAAICQEYAKKDPRVRYYANDFNLGASMNFWRTLHIAQGKYYKWVADDDMMHPTYLARCYEVMEKDDSIALCYTHVKSVTPDGQEREDVGGRIIAMQDDPVDRFLSVLDFSWSAHGFYGLFRKEHLFRIHPVSDECIRLADILMLAETSLFGKIEQIPEDLFIYTQHDKEWNDREKLNARHYGACFPNSRDRGITFPNLKFTFELMQAVRYSDLTHAQKSKLYIAVPQLIKARISGFWTQEIRRAATLVLNQRIFHEWGIPLDAPVDVTKSWSAIPGVYQFHASELLRRFEEVLMIWPDYPEPGIHSSRAVLLALLARIPEAKAAIDVELSKFPGFEAAKQLERNLSAALAKQSA